MQGFLSPITIESFQEVKDVTTPGGSPVFFQRENGDFLPDYRNDIFKTALAIGPSTLRKVGGMPSVLSVDSEG